MTSPSPLAFESCYHIFNRGNNREDIFVQERNYAHFFRLYARYIEPIAETFAFCLLKNHFHLLVRIRSEEDIIKNLTPKALQKSLRSCSGSFPSKQFSDFFNAYAKAMNRALGRTGSLFQHPFGRVLVGNECQFWNVIAYIHQNPQKHKFVKDFREWRWSSYNIMLSEKPTHLQRSVVLEWFGSKQEYLKRHDQIVSEAQSKWFIQEDGD